MLAKLLEILRQNQGTQRVEDLAAALGSSPALVAAMLDDLVEKGYLKQVAQTCAGQQCDSCPLGGFCAPLEFERPLARKIWMEEKPVK
ncbi:MAG: winged helix-turn-helix domain-containing protein [Chloroflexota bacterium]